MANLISLTVQNIGAHKLIKQEQVALLVDNISSVEENSFIKSASLTDTGDIVTVDNTEDLLVGMRVTGTGIDANAEIVSILNNTQVALTTDTIDADVPSVQVTFIFTKINYKENDSSIVPYVVSDTLAEVVTLANA